MKTIVKTEKAPVAIGPYSQGVSTGSLLFISGQLPINPATGVMSEDIVQQTEQSLKNVQAVAEAAGCRLQDVVKATVFLRDMTKFIDMNQVYNKFFSVDFPARSVVEVSALPKGALVEIEAIVNRG